MQDKTKTPHLFWQLHITRCEMMPKLGFISRNGKTLTWIFLILIYYDMQLDVKVY